MSHRLALEVGRTTQSTGAEREVLLAIAERAESARLCASARQIAAWVERHARTVDRALKRLQLKGELTIVAGREQSWYTVERPAAATHTKQANHKIATPKPESSQASSGRGVMRRDAAPRGTTHETDSVTNHVSVRDKSLTARAPARVSQAQLQAERSDRFVTVWNANCSPLPRLHRAPNAAALVRLINRAFDAVDNDAELARAIHRAASNSFYRDQRYGWETFARHVDRWLDGSAVLGGTAAASESNGSMSAAQRGATERAAAELRRQTEEAEARLQAKR